MKNHVLFCLRADAPYTKTDRFRAGHIQWNVPWQGPMMKTGEQFYTLWLKILIVWGTKNPMNGRSKRGFKTSKYSCLMI